MFVPLANCPAGSYYRENNASCVECPVGTYQPVQGQKDCISCGINLTTAFNGIVEKSDCIGKCLHKLIIIVILFGLELGSYMSSK